MISKGCCLLRPVKQVWASNLCQVGRSVVSLQPDSKALEVCVFGFCWNPKDFLTTVNDLHDTKPRNQGKITLEVECVDN